MEMLDVAGVRIAVREWGVPDGIPVVFWHALGSVTSGEYAAELAPALVGRGARVVAPDGPGHGESPLVPRERYATTAVVALAEALLDELGLERVAWIGHSWGAMVGAHLAAARPERVSALVLLDAGYGDPADQPGVEPLAYERRLEQARTSQSAWRWPDWAAFDEDARDGLRRWTPELAAVLRAGVREQDDAVVALVTPEARAAIQDDLYNTSITPTWPALEMLPVLVLVATEPPGLEPYRAAAVAGFRAAVPEADVRRMEGCGYYLVADLGPELAELIGGWLSRHEVL